MECFPHPVMRWTETVYKNVFKDTAAAFRLRDNGTQGLGIQCRCDLLLWFDHPAQAASFSLRENLRSVKVSQHHATHVKVASCCRPSAIYCSSHVYGNASTRRPTRMDSASRQHLGLHLAKAYTVTWHTIVCVCSYYKQRVCLSV